MLILIFCCCFLCQIIETRRSSSRSPQRYRQENEEEMVNAYKFMLNLKCEVCFIINQGYN